MLSDCVDDWAGLLESTTLTVKLAVPCVVGEPLITPVDAFIVKPAGSVPAEMLQTKGAWPPVKPMLWLYGVEIVPFGRVVVVMAGAAGKFTRMLKFCVADCTGLLASVTFTVKLAVPFGPLGAPVIAPVLPFRVTPGGNVPLLTEYARGA